MDVATVRKVSPLMYKCKIIMYIFFISSMLDNRVEFQDKDLSLDYISKLN